MVNNDPTDAKVVLNTRISITWILAALIPIVYSSVRMNYTMESLIRVTDQLAVTIESLNKERELSSREQDRTNSKIDMLIYRIEKLEANDTKRSGATYEKK